MSTPPLLVRKDLVTLPQPRDRFQWSGRRPRDEYSSVEEVGEESDSRNVRPRLPDPQQAPPSARASRDYPSSREISPRSRPIYPSKGKPKGGRDIPLTRDSRCAYCLRSGHGAQECPQNPRNRNKGSKGGKGQGHWEEQGKVGGWQQGSGGYGMSSTQEWKGGKGGKDQGFVENQGRSKGWHRGSRGRGSSSAKGWKGDQGSKGGKGSAGASGMGSAVQAAGADRTRSNYVFYGPVSFHAR